jgi:hypothetical protein
MADLLHNDVTIPLNIIRLHRYRNAMSNNFKHLSALQKSAFILDRILAGKTIEQIVALCDGDKALVRGCIEFMRQIRWLRESDNEVIGSDVTDEGKAAIAKHLNTEEI